MTLTPYLQLIAGARLERFDLDFHNYRNGEDLERTDDLVSPRAGVVVKPLEPLSVYGSYSVSYLPSSGDQFSSLTATTETLEPEKFENYELGAKSTWRAGVALTGGGLSARPQQHHARPTRWIPPAPCRPGASAPAGSSWAPAAT